MDSLPARPATTGPDQQRQAPTTADSDFTLTIDEALARYSKAGLPRTPRSLQRYCALGHLDGRRIDTQYGEKWLITPESVDRHIAYIHEVTPPPGRDKSRPDATSRDTELSHDPAGKGTNEALRQPPTGADTSRPVATAGSDRYVGRLESENEFLRNQIDVKDSQIKELTERARETNVLIGGLQRMLSPLLSNGDARSASSEQTTRQ